MIDESPALSRAGFPSPSERPTEEADNHGLELLIGSNLFRNTNGVVKIHGKEQLVIESKPEEGTLLMTADLYNEGGARIAHLRRNVLALNRSGQFTVDAHQTQTDSPADAPWVRLSDRQSGEIVLEARAASRHKVQIVSGKFYSHKGSLIEITAHYCRLGTNITHFGDIVDSGGKTAVLG
jgi:hypothetical protein